MAIQHRAITCHTRAHNVAYHSTAVAQAASAAPLVEQGLVPADRQRNLPRQPSDLNLQPQLPGVVIASLPTPASHVPVRACDQPFSPVALCTQVTYARLDRHYLQAKVTAFRPPLSSLTFLPPLFYHTRAQISLDMFDTVIGNITELKARGHTVSVCAYPQEGSAPGTSVCSRR